MTSESRYILGMRVDAVSYGSVVAQALRWAQDGTSHYICAANVHMVMEAYDDDSFQDVVNGADIVTPDGMPLVWALRALGVSEAERVYGPTLQEHALQAAATAGVPIGFYGGSEAVLETLCTRAQKVYPGLTIAYAYSPPFRPLQPEERAAIVEDINDSGTRLLFVGLGCPKQERWMAAHHHQIQAVMFGVGAAFDFFAQAKPQAPALMQKAGLEWLFRLASEPRRLGPRYLKHNPRFVKLFLQELSQRRKGKRK